ncbi:Crp/Fnr family transcriptional regulator [Soonwooa sp.]|uniref:Crp/Fnr family transcriptional regulator n=1 Tax=Soonwooa sp. TaxID=1938592 RepID=UPI002618049D|nr:Crp/Fnr family transcriptional regulator [Soonwooa sp.]
MNLYDIINSQFQLSPEATSILIDMFDKIELPKQSLILEANKVEKHLYFIKKGLVRAYTEIDSQEITFWFGTEGHLIIPMNSYVFGNKNYENIELLEDCILYRIEIAKLQNLYFENKEIANWGRRLAETELVATELRLINRISMQAKDRYLDLLHQHPNLLQRAALRHIASYLGITQVSLSRIRSQITF